MDLKKIIQTLEKTKGLYECHLLEDSDKDIIQTLEEKRNQRVLECIKRKYTLMILHDASFRPPITPIVTKQGKELQFPGIAFPEVKAKNVISSSPGMRVHKFLIERFHLEVSQEDASLLIGFD